MLIVNKSAFTRGMFLLLTFMLLFAIILMPLFKDENGKSITGLEYADAVFNSLSKGSSYFIPEVQKRVQAMKAVNVDVTVAFKNVDRIPRVVMLLEKAGMTVKVEGDKLHYSGNLGSMLEAAVADSDLMYHNDGMAVSRKYETDLPGTSIMGAWWQVLSGSIKPLQRQGKLPEANLVDAVVRRAVEPGNNFYSVPATKVMDHLFLMSGLLIFYVLYTLWYGFAIFEIFDGVGLTMTKSKVKQEG